MSYASEIVLFIVFLIPAGIYAVTRLISLRQHEKEEQAELDLIFTNHKQDW